MQKAVAGIAGAANPELNLADATPMQRVAAAGSADIDAIAAGIGEVGVRCTHDPARIRLGMCSMPSAVWCLEE